MSTDFAARLTALVDANLQAATDARDNAAWCVQNTEEKLAGLAAEYEADKAKLERRVAMHRETLAEAESALAKAQAEKSELLAKKVTVEYIESQPKEPAK